MAYESWISPEETPALADEAIGMIDARFAAIGEGARLAFWASIRRAYNTPYNPPAKPTAEPVIVMTAHHEVVVPFHELPHAAIAAASIALETQAA